MIYDLRDLASTYCNFDGIDSSLIYYRKAYDLASVLKNPQIMNMVQSQMGEVNRKIGKFDLIKKAMRLSLKSAADRIKSGICSIAADLYSKMGNTDSAFYYYNELLDFGSLYSTTDAHWYLAKLALEKGKVREAKVHLEQYMEQMDSVRDLPIMNQYVR